MCVGIVSEDGKDLVVFDKAGKPCRFEHPQGQDIRDLCFHSHGVPHDDLLSPCFDGDGLHGEAEESCFCGEETPHIHAHVRGKACEDEELFVKEVSKLATQVLYSVHDDDDSNESSFLNVAISESMPKECNSVSVNDSQHIRLPCAVQHEDHRDYLVYNPKVGKLHLEHDNCGTCQKGVDIHGTFENIGQRALAVQGEAFHFFRVAVKKFNILDHFAEFLDLDQDPRVQAVKTLPTKQLVRSIVVCPGICCASEIPLVQRLVESHASQVKINVTLRQVILHHDPQVVTATQLAAHLESLGGAVLKDGGAAVTATKLSVTSLLQLAQNSKRTSVEEIKSVMPEAVQEVERKEDVVAITYDPLVVTAQQVATLLGDGCAVQQDGAEQLMDKTNKVDTESTKNASPCPRPTVVLSGVFWILSMLSFIGGKWKHLQWVALLSVAFGLPPIGLKAFASLKRFHCDTNCLMFFASIGAVALQEYAEAAAVVFLFALSEWLETRATTRARQALAAIVELQPDSARLLREDGQLLLAPAAIVPVGSLVSVNTGDKVPCDGIVVQGSSAVDESSLTGESRPIMKAAGNKVSGGTVNCGLSPLTVRTTSTSDDSAIARLVRLVEEAQANRSATEACVERFAALYTPLVIVSALFMCTIPWSWGRQVGQQWTHTGLVILVVACPCALIISTPVSYVAGLAATAAHGVLIKGGAYLEALAQTKHICFDKLNVMNTSYTRREILEYLCVMEEKAAHPVAQAILKGARNEQVPFPKHLELVDHKLLKGEGVEGIVDGRKVHVGNQRLFKRLGLLKEDEAQKVITGYMCIEGHGIVCNFTAADRIRPETAKVIKSLHSMGIEVTMLTGDNETAAKEVGSKVGLKPANIRSALLPEEKLAHVKNLVAAGESQFSAWNPIHWFRPRLVMMCGDGVNDAPALAAANVGVAMGEGAALSMETADITLLDSNLEKVEYSIRMGRRVTAKIVQNVVFSVVVKFVVLGFALAGKTQLWAAIGSDVGAMLLVTLNAMMLLPKRQKQVAQNTTKTGDVEKGKCLTSHHQDHEHTSCGPETHGCSSKAHSHDHAAKACCSSSAVNSAKKWCSSSAENHSAHSHDHHVTPKFSHHHGHEHTSCGSPSIETLGCSSTAHTHDHSAKKCCSSSTDNSTKKCCSSRPENHGLPRSDGHHVAPAPGNTEDVTETGDVERDNSLTSHHHGHEHTSCGSPSTDKPGCSSTANSHDHSARKCCSSSTESHGSAHSHDHADTPNTEQATKTGDVEKDKPLTSHHHGHEHTSCGSPSTEKPGCSSTANSHDHSAKKCCSSSTESHGSAHLHDHADTPEPRNTEDATETSDVEKDKYLTSHHHGHEHTNCGSPSTETHCCSSTARSHDHSAGKGKCCPAHSGDHHITSQPPRNTEEIEVEGAKDSVGCALTCCSPNPSGAAHLGSRLEV